MKRLALLFAGILCSVSAFCQYETTVGLVHYDSQAYNGYTLISPTYSSSTFLINNCGELINEWQFSELAFYTGYLLEDGSLMKIILDNGNIGKIEHRDWDNNVIWQYELPPGYGMMHSDLATLPNGNVLVPVEIEILFSDWVDAGGSVDFGGGAKTFEKIVEIQPTGPDTGDIVWEWSLWDRGIQENDSSLPNFATVADSPGKFDINMEPSLGWNFVWTHFNGLANRILLLVFIGSIYY